MYMFAISQVCQGNWIELFYNYNYLFLIEEQLLYSNVLVSAKHQHESIVAHTKCDLAPDHVQSKTTLVLSLHSCHSEFCSFSYICHVHIFRLTPLPGTLF